MKKSIKISAIASLIFIGFLFIVTFPHVKIRNLLIQQEVFEESSKVQEAIKKYDVVKCKFKLNAPEYAFVDLEHYIYPERNINNKSFNTYFFTLSRPHILSFNWQTQYTGGTTIENTTFPELVEMVKDDCEQFKHPYYDESELGDLTGMDDFEKTERWHETEFKNINWSYSPYTPEPPKVPEPELTEEEQKILKEREREAIMYDLGIDINDFNQDR